MDALIPRSTITEIVGYRDAALKAYAEAIDAIAAADAKIDAANELVRMAAPLNHSMVHAQAPEITAFQNAVNMPDRESYIRTARRLTDIRVWGHLIAHTELDSLMDKEAKDQLRDQMAFIAERVDPQTGALINQDEIDQGLPPVSVDVIESTLRGFAEDAGTIFRRGIANAFSKLDRRFRSHDGFKVGARMILDRAFDDWGTWNHYANHRDTVIDIERVFLVLDGKSPKATYGGIVGAVDEDRRAASTFGGRQSVVESDYFRVRIFKNGNAHVWFKRDDLVEKVNLELAAYYGEVIGDGPDRDDVEENYRHQMAVGHARHFGFFPTPEPIVDRVMEAAMIRDGDRVLEPSAGTGNLARAAVKAGGSVWAIEIQTSLIHHLEEFDETICGDFLRMRAPIAFDRIVMNPPFDRERDIDHVRHAFEWLTPGGWLVAVMSAGVEYRGTKKSTGFRKWVEKNGGEWRDLPLGSFAESGTNVSTVLLKIGKKA